MSKPAFILPTVEKGLPVPPAKRPRKQRVNPPSPWIAFLMGLEVGDSFRVPTFCTANIHGVAKRLGLTIVIKRDGKMYDPNDWRPRFKAAPELYSASRVWIETRPEPLIGPQERLIAEVAERIACKMTPERLSLPYEELVAWAIAEAKDRPADKTP